MVSAPGSALRPGPLDRRLCALPKTATSLYLIAVIAGLVQLATHVGIAMVLARAFSQLLRDHRVENGSATLMALGLLYGSALVAQLVMTRTLGVLSRRAMATLNLEVLTYFASGVELSRERAGGLAIAMTSGLAPLEGYFSKYLPALVQSVLTPLVLLSVVVALDPLAALVLLVGLLALPFLTAKVAAHANASAAKQWRALYALSARYSELLRGLATLRLLNATRRARREVDDATTNYATTTMTTLRLAFQSSLTAEFTSGVAVGLTAMIVGFQLMAGSVAAASAFTILLIAAEVYAPLRRTSAEFHNAAGGRAAAATLLALLEQELPEPLTSVTFDENSATVSFRQTSVALPNQRHTTPLTGSATRGQVLVIAGDSGTGKTTLLHQIARSLGSAVAVAPQHIDLFQASVADNLVLDGRKVPSSVRDAACRATGFDQVVAQLAQGFATPLGDGGVMLSTGEQRKLGLTRVLLADRPVIVLDEPTANLDEASIAHLRAELPTALANRVVLMSAHSDHTVLPATFTHDLGRQP